MAIIRIVGGNMKNISKGKTELWAKDGDFEVDAAGQNEWDGEQEGIIEKSYQPLHARDSLQKSPKTLTISFFFDGTLNNKNNTKAREKNTEDYKKHSNKKNDSYMNDYSNVAKGFEAAKEVPNEYIKIYIEGIGTTNYDEDDSFFGPAMGSLENGIKGKVDKSFSLLNKELRYIETKEYDKIYINVFGFSRGAAAARHFLSVANKNLVCYRASENKYSTYLPTHEIFDYESNQPTITLEYGVLDYILLRNNIKYKSILFRFAGLYDTVSSFWFPHFNDVYELDLRAIKYAHHSIQIQALDEYRYNFDLTNIKSVGIRGDEYALPGVHSDIGGSYLDVMEENMDLHIGTKDSCEKFKEILINEGWFKEEQLKVMKTGGKIDKLLEKLKKYEASGVSMGILKVVLEGLKRIAGNIYCLRGKRKVKNNYDKIPLRWMFVQSEKYLKYNEEYKKELEDFNDDFIKDVYSKLLGYLNDKVEYRNYYVKLYNEIIDNKTISNDEKNKMTKDIEKEYMSPKDIFIYEGKRLYLNYRDHIDEEDLKKLRNEYFHWSARYEIAHLPRVFDPEPEENRKRHEHDG